MAHPVYPSSIAFTSSTKISSARASGENLHGQSYYFPHLLFNGNNDSESVPSTNPISNLAFIQSWTINYFVRDVPLLQLLVNFSFLGILCCAGDSWNLRRLHYCLLVVYVLYDTFHFDF